MLKLLRTNFNQIYFRDIIFHNKNYIFNYNSSLKCLSLFIQNNNNGQSLNHYYHTKSCDYQQQQQQQHQQANQSKQGKTIEHDTLKAQFVEDGVRMNARQRLKQMAIVYGPLATVLHISLSLTFLGITYLIIKFGFDATGLIHNLDLFGETYMKILSTGGTFGLAYAIYKAMMPLRILVTIFLTPKVATKLQSMGLIKRRF